MESSKYSQVPFKGRKTHQMGTYGLLVATTFIVHQYYYKQ